MGKEKTITNMAKNFYHNVLTGPIPNAVMPNPDSIDESYVERSNQVMGVAAEVVRDLVGAHQSAIAIIAQKDWDSGRRYFSLSSKYADWADYDAPAKGLGTHGWLLEFNAPVRMTQAELEAHPAWKEFGEEESKHPPMRGWLAAPIIDSHGTNWGLIQASDKYEGDFTEEDEEKFLQFAHLVSMQLETLWDLHNLQKANAEKSGHST